MRTSLLSQRNPSVIAIAVVAILVASVGIPTPSLAISGPTTAPPAPPAIDFVTANGRELEIGGRPWRFTGMNIYNAACDGWCNFAYTDATLAQALDEIGLGGDQHGVIRAWFFQPQAIDKGTDTRTWTRLDRVLRLAAEKGYRVIPTLTDQWKTTKGWTGCRELTITFSDGSVRCAIFSFSK